MEITITLNSRQQCGRVLPCPKQRSRLLFKICIFFLNCTEYYVRKREKYELYPRFT